MRRGNDMAFPVRVRPAVMPRLFQQGAVVCAALLIALPQAHAQLLPDLVSRQVCHQLMQTIPTGVSADRLHPRRRWSNLPALRSLAPPLLQHHALRFGFAHDPVTLDVNQDGQEDLAYGVDVVGQVWRFRLPASSGAGLDHLPAITRLAELGGAVLSAGDRLERAFMLPLALAVQQELQSGRSVVTLAIASGWLDVPHARVHDDGLFVMRDAAPFGGADSSVSLRPDSGHPQVQTWQEAAANPSLLSSGLLVQWLNAPGEKVLVTPLIRQGVAYFVSYVPGDQGVACPPLPGEARLYSLDLRTDQPALAVAIPGPIVADDFRHHEPFPADAAWLGATWSLPDTDGAVVLDLAGKQVLGPYLTRRIETLLWRRLPSYSSP